MTISADPVLGYVGSMHSERDVGDRKPHIQLLIILQELTKTLDGTH